MADTKLRVRELDQLISGQEVAYDDLMGVHDEERAAIAAADKAQEEKDRKNAEFNERAGEVIEQFSQLGKDQDKFRVKMQEKQAELEEVQNADEPDYDKVTLLEEYVSVYQQQIDILQGQIDESTYDFELITEEKRLREENERALAAEKAKEAEYNDMRAALDDAKETKDHIESEYNRAQKDFDENCGDYEAPEDDDQEGGPWAVLYLAVKSKLKESWEDFNIE